MPLLSEIQLILLLMLLIRLPFQLQQQTIASLVQQQKDIDLTYPHQGRLRA